MTPIWAFFSSLLSCSLSRVQTQLFVSAAAEGAGSEERTAGDRTRRRRLNKLSCADWLPHDRGFVWGCLALVASVGPGDRLITGQEDSPPWSCRRQCTPADFLLSTSVRCRGRVWSALERRLSDVGNRPDKADHLTSDCRGDYDLRLACRSKPPIARAQPDLPFPSDVADRRRQLLVAVVKLAADACRHAVGPGSFDQHAPCQHIAGLGDAATSDAGAGRVLGRHQAEIGHQLSRIGKPSKVADLGYHGDRNHQGNPAP